MKTIEQLWYPQAYPSGTHIVTDGTRGPWLYVLFINPTDIEDEQIRWEMCEQLAAWMNEAGPRPAWLNDMQRINEREAVAVDGSRIEATGPMYDKDPPNLWWEQCEKDESKDARARLMDRVFRKV